ncbi:MAG: MucR family transcriptional regulator [Phyllobacterium sp.]
MKDSQQTGSAFSTLHVELTVQVISAYVRHNSLPASDLGGFIETIHAAIATLGGRAGTGPMADKPVPAVNPKKSILGDHLICLEDGRKFTSLKRHLWAQHGMTPDQYRHKWGLDSTYPMAAPNYAAKRSALAKKIGLGQKGAARGRGKA